MSLKLEKIAAEREKARRKRDEWEERRKEWDRKYHEQENSEICEMVHAQSPVSYTHLDVYKRQAHCRC